MQYTTFPTDKASDMFLDSFYGGGGIHVECHCGIQHYAVDSVYNEPNDVFPTESDTVRYHRHDDGVMYLEMDGELYVSGCDGCRRSLFRYEKFFWLYRDHIVRYITLRDTQEKEWEAQRKLLQVIKSGR